MENWQVCIGKNTDLSICTTLKWSLEWIMLIHIFEIYKKKMIQHTEYSIFSNTLVKHNLWCCNVVTENFDFVEKNTMNFSNCSKFEVEEPVINLSK